MPAIGAGPQEDEMNLVVAHAGRILTAICLSWMLTLAATGSVVALEPSNPAADFERFDRCQAMKANGGGYWKGWASGMLALGGGYRSGSDVAFHVVDCFATQSSCHRWAGNIAHHIRKISSLRQIGCKQR